MRERLYHIFTTLTVSDQNTLRVTLTEANHVYIEAICGWTYRRIKHAYTAHGIFDGRDWVLQPGMGSYAPTLAYKGKGIVDAQVFSAFNASVRRVPWFEKLRQQAQAICANNNLASLEEKIACQEKELKRLRVLYADNELIETAAKLGTVPPAYIAPAY